MPTYRCGLCNINYPYMQRHNACEACGEALKWYYNLEPDDNWRDRVARLKDPPPIEWADGHPVQKEPCTISSTVIDNMTVLWIPHGELLDLGYEHLSDFNVVRVNGRYWELQGYHKGIQCWWVDEITELEVPSSLPE